MPVIPTPIEDTTLPMNSKLRFLFFKIFIVALLSSKFFGFIVIIIQNLQQNELSYRMNVRLHITRSIRWPFWPIYR